MVTKRFSGKYFFALIVGLVVVLDQLLKVIIEKINPHLNLKVLEIVLVKNTGAGFGIFQGQTLFLGILSLIVAVAVVAYYSQIPKEKFPQTFFALFLGGVIGNMIDRFFRGYVIDFINFKVWPAFNLADACLTIAVIGLVVYYWKQR